MKGKICTLKPILDKYTLEYDCPDFIQVQSNALIEDSDMKHLVSYPGRTIHVKYNGEGIQDSKDLKHITFILI